MEVRRRLTFPDFEFESGQPSIKRGDYLVVHFIPDQPILFAGWTGAEVPVDLSDQMLCFVWPEI